jgi:hypothetical protein
MKRVVWKDNNGVFRCSLLRDNDNESMPQIGIPLEPPPIERILCEAGVDLRNELVSQGLITYQDLMKEPNGVSSALINILRRKIVEAYKLEESNKNDSIK